jgi:hypothetical protein
MLNAMRKSKRERAEKEERNTTKQRFIRNRVSVMEDNKLEGC